MGDRDAKFAGIMSTAATVAAVAAYLKNPAIASNEELVLPEEVINLLMAMAADLDQVLVELQNLNINVQGFPPNGKGFWATGINCVVANQPYQGPEIPVPEGMSIVVKNYPGNPFGTIVHVAGSNSNASNPQSSYPLAVNDAKGWQVQNTNEIFFSATIVPSIVSLTLENPA